MSQGADITGLSASEPHPHGGVLGAGDRLMLWVNRTALFFGMLGLATAACVLTYSVISRYYFKANTDWQDEAAVFSLVGATFLCGAWVQAQRGHIGIEAVSSILPAAVNRIRQIVVDILSCVFCAFFAWKSWTLFHEAWVDKQTTTSTWSPPLAIPYGLMSMGMTLLALQLALQCVGHFSRERRP